MTLSKLQVIAVDHKTTSPPRIKTRREEAQAKYETIWHREPEKFNPLSCCSESLRIERTLSIILDHINLSQAKVCDLGCGSGVLAKKLRDHGAIVDCVDIARNALLKISDEKGISTIHDFVPSTKIDDYQYDLVVAADLIAHLPQKEYRLFINECARLVKKDGIIVISTPIDIYSVDALERLLALLETELTIEATILSYHKFFIQLSRWINMSKQPWLMKKLESFCRFMCHNGGISHAIIVTKRRPLTEYNQG